MAEYLIVGLGNPGAKYERTRHNLGFLVLEGLAEKWGLSFKRGWKLDGKVATGEKDGSKLYLVKPSTYMNLSGRAVVKALHYYKVSLDHLLIIVDDVYVKFGSMRVRPSGGSGGHNGLKSVAASLGTQDYARLRMGVGPQDEELMTGPEKALEDYVLAHFTFGEQVELAKVVEKGVSIVETWLSQGVEAASQLAGTVSQPQKGNE